MIVTYTYLDEARKCNDLEVEVLKIMQSPGGGFPLSPKPTHKLKLM